MLTHRPKHVKNVWQKNEPERVNHFKIIQLKKGGKCEF